MSDWVSPQEPLVARCASNGISWAALATVSDAPSRSRPRVISTGRGNIYTFEPKRKIGAIPWRSREGRRVDEDGQRCRVPRIRTLLFTQVADNTFLRQALVSGRVKELRHHRHFGDVCTNFIHLKPALHAPRGKLLMKKSRASLSVQCY
jgi:hypothetical protein